MSTLEIGTVKAPSGKSFKVKWNQRPGGEIYVSYAGWSGVGKANSASEAMAKAEAWLYDK